MSLENRASGWESPYTLSYSAINSWLATEVRTLGVEAQLEWLGTRLKLPFYHIDPLKIDLVAVTGTMFITALNLGVLGDFSGASVEHFGVTSTFFRRDDRPAMKNAT